MVVRTRAGVSRHWRLGAAYRASAYVQAVGSLDAVFQLSGELVSGDPVSQVLRVTVRDTTFYVKRYFAGGKNLRRYLGRSRVAREWRSLQHFAAVDIPTPPLVAYGEDRVFGLFRRGALVTEAVHEAPPLSMLAADRDPRLRDPSWIGCLTEQVASHTRRLHAGKFAHSDLNWRNILVKLGDPPKAFFLDSPAGGRWFGPMLAYRQVKDLAHLDESAKRYLSRTQRLRFFLSYREKCHLDTSDKLLIERVLRYGRYLESKDWLLGLRLAVSELTDWLASRAASTPAVAPSGKNSRSRPRPRRSRSD